jgi:hypothetical protein
MSSVAYTVGDYDSFNSLEFASKQQSPFILLSYLPPARNTPVLFDFLALFEKYVVNGFSGAIPGFTETHR